MVFGSVLTATELEFSRASSGFMVSILDTLHRLTFQFIKMAALLYKWIMQCTRMEGSHHVN